MSNIYNGTQNQILINWLVKEKNLYTLIKTTNKVYIDNNIETLNFKLDEKDIEKIK